MSPYFIVGESSGIGKALAHKLAEVGVHVFATYNASNEPSDHPNIFYHHLNVLESAWELDFLPETLSGLIYCPETIDLRPFKRIAPADFVADYNLQVVGAITNGYAIGGFAPQ